MWVRGSRLRVPVGKLDAAITQFTQETVPRLKSIPGNAGAVLLVDRPQSICLALTYWVDKAALDASETQATGLRAGVADSVGATIEDVQRLEVVLMERQGIPEAGVFSRGVRFRFDPGKLDGALAYFRETVVPQIKQQKGFRAVIAAVDRQQGRGVISTVWQTVADRQASDTGLASQRQESLNRFGGTDVQVDNFDTVYVELNQAALAGN
jgi:heme-degrading monooxygenase HmoA